MHERAPKPTSWWPGGLLVAALTVLLLAGCKPAPTPQPPTPPPTTTPPATEPTTTTQEPPADKPAAPAKPSAANPAPKGTKGSMVKIHTSKGDIVLELFDKQTPIDRPWQRRPIFGTVRYMNAAGLERKFKMNAYLQRHGS